MSRYVFDIEADDLLRGCKRMWVLVTYNLETGEMKEFLEGDFGWKELFDQATLVVGHNILGYDVFVLKKLFDYDFPEKCNMHDTLIMSQILNYRRFGHKGHSLEAWGEHLGNAKIDFHDFSQYSEEMLKYCKQDVKLNVEVYEHLIEEFRSLKEKEPRIAPYMRAEHYVAKWATEAQMKGWPFDIKAAKELFQTLEEQKQLIHDKLYDRLGMKAVIVDRVPNADPPKGVMKEPKWIKNGEYNSHTAKWFDIHSACGLQLSPDEEEELSEILETEIVSRPIEGPFCRVKFEHLELTSVNDVKLFLFRNGWEPTEWNYKFDEETKEKYKTSPKITEDSLELLGGDGALYSDFLTISSRYNNLKTWIENVDENGRLHGDSITIGTPSMRTRHQIIVNVPSGDSPWGKEMRQLFSHEPGWKLVGCDSAGNQARGLAHYLKNDEFIDVILNGDIHTYNKDALTKALKNMGVDYEVSRPQAKRILYAFLFGASGAKLWSYIFGAQDKRNGNRLKKEFLKAVPGFDKLLKNLENIYGSTSKGGYGYIPSLAGNRIYVDSFHKLLVYLLQAAEKITCSAALMLAVDKLREEKIPFQPLIHYHDEIDFMVPEEYAERAAEIGAWGFKEGPKLFDVMIMDGDGKIGDNWYDIH